MINRITFLAALVVCASPVSAQMITRLDGSYIAVAEADSFARATLRTAHVTGAQIAVINGGKLVWSAAYGLRQRDPDLPMDRGTTTWLGSITKPIFATYVMQLVERGEFNLDEPVARQLAKPLNAYPAYRETAADVIGDSLWPRITPRMLLAHTSGLANFAFVEPDRKMHLHSVPGALYRYSGEGINLLQFIIEQKMHLPLDMLMHDAILAPLRMNGSGLVHRKEFESNIADRFDLDEKFLAKTRRSPARGAGSMSTTAEDVAAFVVAYMGGRVVQPATRAQMLRPAIGITSLHQFPLARNEPEGQEAKDVGLAYGLGWGLLTKTPFGPAFFKEGHGDGAQNYVICFERQQSCMIILTNSDNGELAFRPLLEKILGDTATPWEWEGYTPSYVRETRKQQ
ncbi:MAG: beta-lactamase [Gemmatimonadetes bacterium]|nr:beta-lactamase [Gemmatimonadota bacterium]